MTSKPRIYYPSNASKTRLNYRLALEWERKMFDGRILPFKCLACGLITKRVLFKCEADPNVITCRCGGVAVRDGVETKPPVRKYKIGKKRPREVANTWR